MTDELADNWHAGIIAECEKKLGRTLNPQEKQFIVSRRGLIALEMIQDTVRGLTGSDLDEYLNSESVK